MAKYIALLRGINVSGVKIIKMEDLRTIFARMGYTQVQTYIQSGNVVFDAPATPIPKLTADITKGLATALGYQVPVVVIKAATMQAIAIQDAFTNSIKSVSAAKKYVAFLEKKLSNEQISTLASLANPADTYLPQGDVIYISIDETKGKSLFTNMLLEKKLKLYATTRNWNTVCKLAQM
ncbi:hypothetical protein CAP35_09405 [Chitinophagaceae bacterium IBVUCB1]|nr:hypothetical protein CAP35_09405 [Chitinophagaceae bacterium IBVUCB1]